MARTPTAPVNPTVLVWGREIAGFEVAQVARRLQTKPERVVEWETGEAAPTLAQLRRLARMYRRPAALFFLATPPTDDLRQPPDFRGRGQEERLSPTLRRELRRATDRRSAFLEFHGSLDNRLRSLDNRLRSVDFDPAQMERTAESLRLALDVPLDRQLAAADTNAALRLWIEAAEAAGVLIFQMSRVPQSECRGFSIYEDVLPVVVLNGADPPQARIFTLIHEIGHILQKTGSLCLLWANEIVERRCNALAAEVLMPHAAFLEALAKEDPYAAIPRLAARFRVSREAAAVRLRVLGRISNDQLAEVRAKTARRVEADRDAQRRVEGGPPHCRTHLRNLGANYVNAVLGALHDREITVVDAAYYLESKVATIERMEEELLQREAKR
jgi:Zn-dependent peptidase ImmA (M78 family)